MIVIGIEAISYVGTTLLSMVLGSHPRCHSVGHCYLFFHPYREAKKDILSKENVCSICDLLEKDCDLNVLNNPNLDPKMVYDIIGNCVLSDDEDVIIDSSSTTPWFKTTKPDHIIWMFRDPITLASSYVKSLTDRTRAEAIDYMCIHYIKKYSKASGLAVEYKNIIHDTPYLKGLFEKLGLSYSSDYLEYWNYPNHMIGGSDSVLVNIAKHRRPSKVDDMVILSSKGNAEYKKYYKQSSGNFDGELSLLTPEEENYVTTKCKKVYKRMTSLQDNLL